jgi:hypothetical protein
MRTSSCNSCQKPAFIATENVSPNSNAGVQFQQVPEIQFLINRLHLHYPGIPVSNLTAQIGCDTFIENGRVHK